MTDFKNTIHKLEEFIDARTKDLKSVSETEMSKKTNLNIWSKKEILGHLIDSGINNLQRFTEIEFEDKPYKIRQYNQNKLVITNNYQNSNLEDLIIFWTAINKQILHVIKQQTEVTLNYKIEGENKKSFDLRFLITDYISHLEHHFKQIIQ